MLERSTRETSAFPKNPNFLGHTPFSERCHVGTIFCSSHCEKEVGFSSCTWGKHARLSCIAGDWFIPYCMLTATELQLQDGSCTLLITAPLIFISYACSWSRTSSRLIFFIWCSLVSWGFAPTTSERTQKGPGLNCIHRAIGHGGENNLTQQAEVMSIGQKILGTLHKVYK